mgnify:CR=1 FL=1|jgi:hypothetical protein|tara:strand:+ start:255 stop:1469 length:1215 start_codon:yes stop_codon:yes gene_type:complete
MKKVPKIKYAVGSVAQAAAEGADSLLSEARKDVVAARGPEPAMPKEVEEMAEAVSKVQGSAESEAPKVAVENLKDTTKLVNSFKFQGGNKKMDKAYIMESLSAVADSSIVESKQSIAEFITDLHRVQVEEESKPLLSPKDFEKLTSFASSEERVEKKEGGEMSDADKYIMLYKQMTQSMDKAQTQENKDKVSERWKSVKDSFSGEDIYQALKKMDAENEKKEGDDAGFAEGGSLMAPDMPVDTYDNIPPEEMATVEASQLPDDEMEDEYAGFVLNEALTPEDQDYLLNAIEGDERLGTIFDKVMDIAGEFAGEGAVEGPGTGTSDSIPARLSDGEFVFTRKATDQIGTDELQSMMDDAERAYDGGLMKKYMGGGILSNEEMEDPDKEVHDQMLGANAMPSVRKR